jgi:hypothetical protein
MATKTLETIELKILLKLLGLANYEGSMSQVKPNKETLAAERNKICYRLQDRKWVTLAEEIKKIKLTSSGKALLKVDSSELPITKTELKIIKACDKESITLSKIKGLPAKERDSLIQSLRERGFLEVVEAEPRKIALTETGKTFLLEECTPSGTALVSLNLLGNYIEFLRQNQANDSQQKNNQSFQKPQHKLTDQEVLEIIIQLDKEYNTNNYLPIFYLREQLQPPFNREELDQVLYRLEEKDQITTYSLVETKKYSEDQINAGIKQPVGGPLFFITVIK